MFGYILNGKTYSNEYVTIVLAKGSAQDKVDSTTQIGTISRIVIFENSDEIANWVEEYNYKNNGDGNIPAVVIDPFPVLTGGSYLPDPVMPIHAGT